jgi:uncharacterized protein involved in outer membrane biogenesis
MKKIWIRIVIGLVVLLIAAVLVAGFSLGGIVKRGIETIGPKLTKVDIKLDKVGLSLFSGSGKIDGLVVGNPEGFKTPQAIRVGSASLALSPGSLLSDKIVIKSIQVEAPEITYEIGAGGSNLKKILANLDESTGSANAAAKPKEAGPGRKLEVDDFLITGAKLHLGITALGSATVPLPAIHLTGLGKGDAGITAADLTKRVLAAIEQAAAKAATDSAGAVAKSATSLVKGLTGGTNNAAGDAAGKPGKSVSDLLKTK